MKKLNVLNNLNFKEKFLNFFSNLNQNIKNIIELKLKFIYESLAKKAKRL